MRGWAGKRWIQAVPRWAPRVLAVTVAAALALVVAGAALAPRGGGGEGPVQPGDQRRVAASADAVQRLRDRVARVPGDWQSWAELGLTYLEQARASADPAWYPQAEQAFQRSLGVRPAAGNAPASAGLGALAAARHDFAAALAYGRAAVAADPYLAAARGVVVDALVELGRYPEAWQAAQDMVDLRPDTASYARASYTFELRGDRARAAGLMRQALEVAPGPAQVAFARYHLGMLAFDGGDLDGAWAEFDAGLRAAPGDPALLAGRSRVEAARGQAAAAVADLRTVVERLPLPGYAAELGDLYESTGDGVAARQQYDLVRTAAALQAAQGVDVDAELALFHADHGAAAAALAAAQAAYQRRPSIGTADALAWALHAGGRDDEALRHADEALRLGTRSALLRYHRGVILAGLGRTGPARVDLSAALDLNPYFSVRHAPLARAALARLGGAR